MDTCATCGAELPAEARFCPACGAPVEEAAPAGEMLKLVTVLFADVVGSTARAEALHPEDVQALMADYFSAMSEEIRAEGGTIEKYVGDAIMAVFGVPAAHEDDPIRAVRAARRMLQRLGRWNEQRDPVQRIAIRIGVNTGDVIAAAGEDLRVAGDAVNVAARFQQTAEPGQVVVGERTARAARDFFDLTPIDPLELKGKAEPVEAWVVAGEREEAQMRGVPGLQAPMIGRDRELDILSSLFAGAWEERSPHLVTIIGDAGVGKSRLVRELVATLDVETKVVVGRCIAYGEGVTLWPLGEILKAEAVVLENDPAETALAKIETLVRESVPPELAPQREETVSALASTIGLGEAKEDPREAYRALLSAWRAFLAALAQTQPLVVVVEDLHWADRTMLEVLDDLAAHLAGPVLFLCTARPDLLRTRPDWGGGKRNYSAVPLDPLTAVESDHLVSLLLEVEELPAELKERMLERAEGNPFFLEEIVRRLIDEGLLVHGDGRWIAHEEVARVEIPDTVQGVILSRIDLLSPIEKRALQRAAVVGRTFWSGAVANLTGEAELDEVLDTLCRRELVVERLSSSIGGEVEYAFKHVLIRDVAYESLPRRERAKAHVEVANWIEAVSGERAPEFAEFLAHHYDVAFSLTGEDALRCQARELYLSAAESARRRWAVAQAIRFGRRAVELSAPGRERAEAGEQLGDVCYHSMEGDEAWRVYTDAVVDAAAGDPRSVARLAAKACLMPTRWLGSMHAPPSREQVEALIANGLAAAVDGSAEQAQLLAGRAFLHINELEPEAAREPAEAAFEIASRLGDPDLLSCVLDAVCARLMPEGRYAELRGAASRRLELIPRLTHAIEIGDSLAMMAWSEVHLGLYRDGVEHASRGMEMTRGVHRGGYLHCLSWRMCGHFMAGDWRGALDDQAEIELLEAEDARELPVGHLIRAYAAAGFCRELRGEHQDADRYLDLLRRYLATQPASRLAGAASYAARALAHQERADEARTLFPYVGRNASSGLVLEALCDVLAVQEDWDEGERTLALARQEAEECGLLALPSFADRLEGRMRSDPEVLRRSAEGFAALHAPWEEAWSRLLLAELTDDADEAARALPVFERVSSVQEIERARALLGARR